MNAFALMTPIEIGKAFIREHLDIREKAEDELYSLWWYKPGLGAST
ncbi:MAG: hypothetical protein LBU43_12110 [Candidatus Accumulibacter sp.]|jgi:hypothetical protein|nr:hypothetical protein [Accumulibacter sp.]